jgi:hypothetical protein
MTDHALIQKIAALPIGRYRYIMGQIRRARRGDVTKKIPSRRIRQDAADVRWSHDVRQRDKWCRKCGIVIEYGKSTVGPLDAAHIVPRRYKKTRLLLENGLALCRKDHRWAHDHPADFKEWIIGEIGQSEWDRLWQIARGGEMK